MARHVRHVERIRRRARAETRADARDELGGVRHGTAPVLVGDRVPFQEQRVAHVHGAGVVRLHPPLVALEANAARVLELAAEHHLHAVGIVRAHLLRADRLVLRGGGELAPEGELAEVDRVRAPFAQVAVEVVLGVPRGFHHVVRIVRAHRRGAHPHVPEEVGARRQGLFGQVVVDRAAAHARHAGVDRVDAAEAAGLRELHGGLEVAHVAALHAALVDALVQFRGAHHRLALRDGEGDGLLAVDVLARAHGGDGEARVPAVARGNVEGVEVLARQQLAVVVVHGAVRFAVEGVDLLLGPFAARAHHVAGRDEADARLVQEYGQHLASAPARADDGHRDRSTRRRGRLRPRAARGERARGERALEQEPPS